jgi:ABC-type nitrate/sulfonate/bicarbonate transport system substrate-binding protein
MKSIRGDNVDHESWMRRREFLKAGGLGALGLVLAAATTRGASAQDATPSIENVRANLSTLRLGIINPNYVQSWPLLLASVHGYFSDVGLETVEGILTDQYIPGLIGGSLEMTQADMSVALAAADSSEMPIKVISIFRQAEEWMMAVRPGISTVEELRGGTVSGGALGSRNAWVLRQVLTELGLDPDRDVQFVPASGGSDGRMAALLSNTLDAAIVFPRHRAGIEAAGGRLLFERANNYPQEGIVALGPWLTENEDTVYAWALADLRARQWLNDPANREEAYRLAREWGFEITPEAEALYEVEIHQLSPDGGFESTDDMDVFVSQLAETENLPANLDWRQHFELKYVWAAQDALGLPRRPASL